MMKKRLIILVKVGILGTSSFIFASANKPPVDVLSGLTGTPVETLEKQRAAGKTYGSIAADANKLEEFKSEVLKQKKARLNQRVKDGLMTQEEADSIYNSIKNNQKDCDGAGSGRSDKGRGMGFGNGKGNGQGQGRGQGLGGGRGMKNK